MIFKGDNMGDCKRIEWVDMLKGFGIILVMLGHAPFPEPLRIELYTFHMPLFFFLSGYVFSIKKYSNFKEFLIHKAKTLLLPLMVFSIFMTIVSTIFDILSKIGYSNLITNLNRNIFDIIFQARGETVVSALWFIGCIFFCQVIFYLILKIVKEDNLKILISINIVFIIGVIYRILIDTNLPYSIDVSLIAILFLGLGYLFKIYFEKIKIYFKLKYIILYLSINILFGFLNFKSIHGRIDMFCNIYGNYLFFIISAISGIFMCITLFFNIKKISVLNYIGKNSLIYYSLHQYMVFKLIEFIIPQNLFGISNIGKFFLGIIYTILACGILYFVSEIINKKLPFILGKANYIKH